MLGALAALLLVPGAAQADSVGFSDEGVVQYQGDAGESHLRISNRWDSPDTLRFEDRGARPDDPLIAGPGCSSVDGQLSFSTAICQGVERLGVGLGAGDDEAVATWSTTLPPSVLSGGRGSDELRAASQVNRALVLGGGGYDRIELGWGNRNRVHGGPGTDVIRVGGSAPEDAALCAHVFGDSGNDIFASWSDTCLPAFDGGAGRDTLRLIGRHCYMASDGGSECLGGSRMRRLERVLGSESDDLIVGREHRGDTIAGDLGVDVLRAGAGNANDLVFALDGIRDGAIACGGGAHDIAILDRRDPLPRGCEHVRRRECEKPEPGPSSPPCRDGWTPWYYAVWRWMRI